ncbi:hypothetical protein F5144DRAFT_605275 [Chaetomium tenue]|uniref:Uncharacterized protein n=1 Tax=Chaetomium tenue TaxID=1854479 RepID=A0ACB7NYP7_9PEZI|nr:hypothetical protein F5144DRAFT_605275 [Chaetomium globosum]
MNIGGLMAVLRPMHEGKYSPRHPSAVYCRSCSRSYAVDTETESVNKKFIPRPKKWAQRLDRIKKTTSRRDIGISGGGTHPLEPEQVQDTGDRLREMTHTRHFRSPYKRLGVSPSRRIDPENGRADGDE